jgi:hypothetical protein
MWGPGFRSAHPGYELAGAGDAAFFSVGARSSDLDKLSGRLTTCPQAN